MRSKSWIQYSNVWNCSLSFSLSAVLVMKYKSSILIYITDIISNVIPIKMEFSYFMTDIALRVNERLQIQRLLV